MCFHRRHNVTPVSLSTKLTLVKMAGLYYLGYQSAVRSPQILIYTAVPGWNKLFGMMMLMYHLTHGKSGHFAGWLFPFPRDC